VKVRVITYNLTQQGRTSSTKGEKIILLTNLFDHQEYPATELAELYHERWEIETVFTTDKSFVLPLCYLRRLLGVMDFDREVSLRGW
jgi:IS4 transposase